MALISVGTFKFSIMPETAMWRYSMYIKSIDTYGGKVVQLLNSSIDSLSVEGYIRPRKPAVEGSGESAAYPDIDIVQWQGMREFEYQVRQIMSYHEQSKAPVHFSFPEVGWDGDVFLTGYTDVRYEVDAPAVTYRLKFDVDSGFDSVLRSASAQGLDNVPDGVGWVRNIYNTPKIDDWSKAKKAIEKIVDEAGSFSAEKCLDYIKYFVDANDGSDDMADSVATLASSALDMARKSATDAVFTSAASSIVDSAKSVVRDPLVALGLVPSKWGR